MRYIPHTEEDVRAMLACIDVGEVSELFSSIPEKLRLERPLAVPRAASESEVVAELEELAERNTRVRPGRWFLGAGAYAHFIPSVVDALISRAEFATAYTPYQPEFSQGTLQAIFEWQTMISGLTGLEVSNASMYDGASSLAEAALMAMRVTRRNKVLVSAALHPAWRQVLETYLGGLKARIETLPRGADGRSESAADAVDDETACVILQQPNFLGCVEELEAAAETAHAHGALLVVGVAEALSLALLRAPGDAGADLVCGEAQSFGVPLGYGGPHLGFLATRERYVRQLPGRLVGETVDTRGHRGFVLTLSTREQHIRRERATSNICTNQGLCLLMATIYLALMGRRGLADLARDNFSRAHYARSQVEATAGLSLPLSAPGFNEFVVGVPDSASDALDRARAQGLVGGLDLQRFAPELGPAVLVCTTELCNREAIDRLVSSLAGAS